MKAVTVNSRVPALQDLLDAVPADRMVACLPTPEFLILHDGEKELGRIPLDGVVDVSVLDDSSVERHVSIGLFLILGPLAFLFPKKTIREAYRLCLQWKDLQGDYHFTNIRTPKRSMADHMLDTVHRSLTSEVRKGIVQKVSNAKEGAAISGAPHQHPAETSPFITCGKCAVEFRKTDLPPGGKCPVCGHRLNPD
jgi:hypothetical protein